MSPPLSNLNHINSRAQDLRGHIDPLSKPSGFVASTDVNNASKTRPIASQGRALVNDDGESDNERPRKRVRPISDPLNLFAPGSPPSPEITRPGQRRPAAKMTGPSLSLSSDGSYSGQTNRASSGPKKSSGRESSIPEALKTFRVVNAWIDQEKVDAAFYKANGDISLATNLVLDPDFHPKTQQTPPSSSSTTTPTGAPPPPRIVGKVKEVEEEREAKRAHQRDIASKSHIYRRRSAVDPSSPSSSSVSLAPVVTEPDSSPIRQPLTRLKQRRVVIESESEDDSSGNDDTSQLIDSFEKRTLQSFNEFGNDALRELTGNSKSYFAIY